MTGYLLRTSVLALTCVVCLAGTATARTVFDGSWSIVIYAKWGLRSCLSVGCADQKWHHLFRCRRLQHERQRLSKRSCARERVGR
jgi:hypothetical protein